MKTGLFYLLRNALRRRDGKPVPYKILKQIRVYEIMRSTGGYRIRPYGIYDKYSELK